METQLVELKFIDLPWAPEIPGLTFRKFSGPQDFPAMLTILHASEHADGIQRALTLEEITHNYTHMADSNPYEDVLIAEIAGEPAAYSRVSSRLETDNGRIYMSFGFVVPRWRRKGLGKAMLRYNQQRMRQIATQPGFGPGLFESFASDQQAGAHALLLADGYRVARNGYEMVRPNLEDLPAAPMPPGLEVRPVELEHVPAINAASIEAFRDHWGFSEEDQPTVQSRLEDPLFDPSLWKVAWDGDQVAGMVLTFVDKVENETFNRRRGYTENICVRRPWRKRGLAKSLLVQSLAMLKEQGYQEAALGVDAENLSGALRLYESVGFQVVKTSSTYRREMD